MYFISLNFWESVYPIFVTSCTASLFCGLPVYFGYLGYCTVYNVQYIAEVTAQVANFKISVVDPARLPVFGLVGSWIRIRDRI